MWWLRRGLVGYRCRGVHRRFRYFGGLDPVSLNLVNLSLVNLSLVSLSLVSLNDRRWLCHPHDWFDQDGFDQGWFKWGGFNWGWFDKDRRRGGQNLWYRGRWLRCHRRWNGNRHRRGRQCLHLRGRLKNRRLRHPDRQSTRQSRPNHQQTYVQRFHRTCLDVKLKG